MTIKNIGTTDVALTVKTPLSIPVAIKAGASIDIEEIPGLREAILKSIAEANCSGQIEVL